MMRTKRTIMAIATVPLLAVGCGGGDDDNGDSTTEPDSGATEQMTDEMTEEMTEGEDEG